MIFKFLKKKITEKEMDIKIDELKKSMDEVDIKIDELKKFLDEKSYKFIESFVDNFNIQTILTPKKDQLPKSFFIYGYMYAYIDRTFQMSIYKKNEALWMQGALVVFLHYYGAKHASYILQKSEKLTKENKDFIDGSKVGAEEAYDMMKFGKYPKGISKYILEHYENLKDWY